MTELHEISGLPAHALFLHFVVVLVPLTALLEIACALWRPVRRRLVWLTLILAAATAAITPITVNAGEWLISLHRKVTPILSEHADRAEWMPYFAAALLAVAIVLAMLHIVENRSEGHRPATQIVVAILALAVGLSSMFQVYRVGDAGSRSVWGDEIAKLEKEKGS
jgi:uncharacterized membrane protein